MLQLMFDCSFKLIYTCKLIHRKVNENWRKLILLLSPSHMPVIRLAFIISTILSTDTFKASFYSYLKPSVFFYGNIANCFAVSCFLLDKNCFFNFCSYITDRVNCFFDLNAYLQETSAIVVCNRNTAVYYSLYK